MGVSPEAVVAARGAMKSISAPGASHALATGVLSSMTAEARKAEVACRLIRGVTRMQDIVICHDNGEERRFELPAEVLRERATEAEDLPMFSEEWWIHVACAVVCVCSAAMAAGLTMGLMSLDEFDMELLLETKAEETEDKIVRKELVRDQSYARLLHPLISKTYFKHNLCGCMPTMLDPSNHHYLLVTLLLVNSAANEALPVFLDNLVPAWVAVLISVSLVLVFGEIIPSAVFTGPRQLSIAAKFATVVRTCEFILMPLVWPISLALDGLLGPEKEALYTRSKIKALVRLQPGSTDLDRTLQQGASLTKDEIDIIHGTLDLHRKVAQDIMQHKDSMRMLSIDTKLTTSCMADILNWGHSRLLVYEGKQHNIRGILMVKKLIVVSPDDERSVRQLYLRQPLAIAPNTDLLECINKFQEGKSHIALVTRNPEAMEKAWHDNEPLPAGCWPIGFFTLEDVFEELLKEEVFDEEDHEKIMACVQQAGRIVKLKRWAENARAKVKERHEAEQAEQEAAAPHGLLALMHRHKRVTEESNSSATAAPTTTTTPLLNNTV